MDSSMIQRIALLALVLQFCASSSREWKPAYPGQIREQIEIEDTYIPRECGRKGEKTVLRGHWVDVHVHATIKSTGHKFEDTEEDETFVFQVGMKKVIAGLDRGVFGMCVGQQRRVHVPHTLGFGKLRKKGKHGEIPPESDLVLEIELLEIRKKAFAIDMDSNHTGFRRVDRNYDGWLDKNELFEQMKKVDVVEARLEKRKQKDDKGLELEVRNILALEDKNHDGKISWEEFSGNPAGAKHESGHTFRTRRHPNHEL